ncbi:MAG: hypothetical protein BWX84_00885 [Verrucomicrobia bacterium ADurb.Bin118]|nr:MAG: hypothetical protein BWX84_00885 [Verrucomicrobia bacterium ADurb.Bin118]
MATACPVTRVFGVIMFPATSLILLTVTVKVPLTGAARVKVTSRLSH